MYSQRLHMHSPGSWGHWGNGHGGCTLPHREGGGKARDIEGESKRHGACTCTHQETGEKGGGMVAEVAQMYLQAHVETPRARSP